MIGLLIILGAMFALLVGPANKLWPAWIYLITSAYATGMMGVDTGAIWALDLGLGIVYAFLGASHWKRYFRLREESAKV